MPIYAYRCAACGHAKDVLQKMSDPVLTQCPSCGAEAFTKQLTAAGFQLKGSGWYVTDFRGGSTTTEKPKEGAAEAAKPVAAGGESKSEAAATPAPAPAAAPAASTPSGASSGTSSGS